MADTTPPLPPSVTLDEGPGGLARLRVRTRRCDGELFLMGAHVTQWTPAASEPVLWMSQRSQWVAGQPIRGGVPVCGPWFGPGRKGGLSPAHGWLRIVPWELAAVTDDGDAVSVRLVLDGANASHEVGRGLTASYEVRFGNTLELALTVTAGPGGLELEEALHSYFGVSDVAAVTVEGLDGCRYVDKAPGGRAVNAQTGPVTFARETDRVYAHEGEVSIVDPGTARRIVITKENSASTVVWNPWAAKAATLPDLGDDEWPRMVCVEVANALRGFVPLEPGQSHTMAAAVAVEPL